MKAINLKLKYGVKAYYEAAKNAFASNHQNSQRGVQNLCEWLLNDPRA